MHRRDFIENSLAAVAAATVSPSITALHKPMQSSLGDQTTFESTYALITVYRENFTSERGIELIKIVLENKRTSWAARALVQRIFFPHRKSAATTRLTPADLATIERHWKIGCAPGDLVLEQEDGRVTRSDDMQEPLITSTIPAETLRFLIALTRRQVDVDLLMPSTPEERQQAAFSLSQCPDQLKKLFQLMPSTE